VSSKQPEQSIGNTIRYDTIRQVILTCAQKLACVSLIYRMESRKKTKKRFKKRICSEVSVNSPGNPGIRGVNWQINQGVVWSAILPSVSSQMTWRFIRITAYCLCYASIGRKSLIFYTRMLYRWVYPTLRWEFGQDFSCKNIMLCGVTRKWIKFY